MHRVVAVNHHAVSTLSFVFQRLLLSSLVLVKCSSGHVNVKTFSDSTDMEMGVGRTVKFYFLFFTDVNSGLSP